MQGSFNRYEETSYIGEDAMTDPADTIASAVSGKAVKSAGLRYVPGNGTLCDEPDKMIKRKANNVSQIVGTLYNGQAVPSVFYYYRCIMSCGHCGGRLTSMVYREKYIRKKDGSVYERKQLKYLCYHKSRGLCKCDGQSTYIAAKVDSVVCELIHKMFENIKDTLDENVVQQRIKKELSSNKALRTKLNTEMTKCGNQLIKLQDEIGLTLTGDSVYTPEQLRNAIKTVEDKIVALKFEIEQLENEERGKKAALNRIRPMFESFVSWSKEFDDCTLEQKKMIIARMLKRIEIRKDYEIGIELNMDYKQFCKDWDTLNPDNPLLEDTNTKPDGTDTNSDTTGDALLIYIVRDDTIRQSRVKAILVLTEKSAYSILKEPAQTAMTYHSFVLVDYYIITERKSQ